MAIALGNTSSAAFDSNTNTHSHTGNSGANRLLVAVVAHDSDADTIDVITYAGVTMTLAATLTGGGEAALVAMYYLVAPATGANNFVITFSGSGDSGAMLADFTGVLQVSPLDGTPATIHDAASPWGTAETTAEANELVIGGFGDDHDAAAARAASNGTEIHDILLGAGAGDYGGWMAYTIAGAAGSYTINYTDASVSASD